MRRTPCLPAALLLAAALLAGACSGSEPGLHQGYAEGEYVYVAAAYAGRLDGLFVRRGQAVAKNAPLFALEAAYEVAGVKAAEEDLARSENRLADMKKGLRPSEMDAIRAQLAQAKSQADLAEIEFKRRVRLLEQNTISREELDRAKTDFETTRNDVRRLQADLRTGGLGSRQDEVKAAENEVRAARAKLAQARWSLDQKTRSAPSEALVFDVIRQEGEWIPAGKPVVSLLPPANRLVRFFVPETEVGGLSPGRKVEITFDGGPRPVPAEISFISPEAEYTPPIIYSSQSRAKLVFRLEARPLRPEDAPLLHPGQPVDVRVLPEEAHAGQ